MIEYLNNKLFSFFDGITITSINYVSWTSAVVVALLALTTIIFSQYNERQINRANDISRQIKDSLSQSISTQTIVGMINELFYVLANQTVYRWTLSFFFVISYLSCFVWIISGIGYTLIPSKLSSGDLLVILLSLVILIITFSMIPIILIQFNNNPPIAINNKNHVSYKAFFKFFKSLRAISEDSIIREYVSPSIELSISRTNIMNVAIKKQIPITDIILLFKFVGLNNKTQIICINHKQNESFLEYTIKPENTLETSFRGLFDLIKQSSNQQLFIYSKDKKELIATYKMTPTKKTNNLYFVSINDSFQLNPDNQISTVLHSKYSFQTFDNSEAKNKYKVILKK